MPEGRAGAQARPLLFLSGLDALIFLAAVALNLEPLLRLDSGLIQSLLIWSAVVLVAAATAGFAGGTWLGKPSASRILVTVSAVLNGVLVAAVALYYAIDVRLFGVVGAVFLLFTIPGFLGAWIAWRSLAP
ncbi:MAG TPA: hypothetical protein VEO18_01385 [Thermoplasmata archaeon]|nr:hypothetical protein [Thermoplasmata archaeon]